VLRKVTVTEELSAVKACFGFLRFVLRYKSYLLLPSTSSLQSLYIIISPLTYYNTLPTHQHNNTTTIAMQYTYNTPAERTKFIMMRFGDDVYWGQVSSSLKEGDETYNALRATFSGVLEPTQDIIIWHPERDEKVCLDYHHLVEGPTYRIEATFGGRQQGSGAEASGGYKKAQQCLEAIRKHWELGDDGEILPAWIAPRNGEGNLVAPRDWPARFAGEVRKLSGHSVGRYQVAMGYLVAAVEARRERGEYPGEVTSGDCKTAMARMMTGTADQAYAQLPEEIAATQMFAGGLAEAAQQALEEIEGEGAAVGFGYEEGGRFNIGTHFRSA